MFWLLLILNFAKRIAEHIGVSKHSIIGDNKRTSVESKRWFVFLRVNNLNRIMLGATPKVIISANESNCFPNSLYAFKIRALSPSRRSKNAPMRINPPLRIRFSLNANMIAHNPQNKLVRVIIFGIFLFIAFISAKI